MNDEAERTQENNEKRSSRTTPRRRRKEEDKDDDNDDELFLPENLKRSKKTTTTTSSQKKQVVGVNGVYLRRYEQVVKRLLPILKPHYTKLPTYHHHDGWPFDQLPSKARVRGNSMGQLKDGIRAERKEGQLRSMLQCIFAMIENKKGREKEETSSSKRRRKLRIVDFCGGTGHLAIPLALLLLQKEYDCEVVVVDLKAASLHLVHEKVRQIVADENDDLTGTTTTSHYAFPKGNTTKQQQQQNITKHEQVLRNCFGIPNLYTFHGSIESYTQHFDIGIALHACGEASDLVLRACGKVGANFIVSPCCVGKLNIQKRNPYIYHATSSNIPTVTYPQCSLLKDESIMTQDDWNELAKAADYNDYNHMRSQRNATRRTAKVLLETDRLLYMKETYEHNMYQTALCRMIPWECTPKNDILLGWVQHQEENDGDLLSPYSKSCPLEPDEECNWDIEVARRHLFSITNQHDQQKQKDEESLPQDAEEWTREEEMEIRTMIEEASLGTNNNESSSSSKFVFPTGMGRRKRKLIHYVAEKMKLKHWGTGTKDNTKTVVVAIAATKLTTRTTTSTTN